MSTKKRTVNAPAPVGPSNLPPNVGEKHPTNFNLTTKAQAEFCAQVCNNLRDGVVKVEAPIWPGFFAPPVDSIDGVDYKCYNIHFANGSFVVAGQILHWIANFGVEYARKMVVEF